MIKFLLAFPPRFSHTAGMFSMTGFGRGEAHDELYRIEVEISSVNRKQAEIVVQCRRDFSAELEPLVRQWVLQSCSRGRIQVSIKSDRLQDTQHGRVDVEAALAYRDSLATLSRALGVELRVTPEDLLRLGTVFVGESETLELETLLPLIKSAFHEAFTAFLDMRRSEGEALKRDLSERLSHLEQLRQAMAERSPQVVTAQRQSLHRRLNEAGIALPLDDERLLKEIALFAERCDISEELTRLHSHFAKFREFFNSPEANGRSLDFLCQETHREFNTIGSKANDAPLAQLVVTAKTELEKIREQVQNIE